MISILLSIVLGALSCTTVKDNHADGLKSAMLIKHIEAIDGQGKTIINHDTTFVHFCKNYIMIKSPVDHEEYLNKGGERKLVLSFRKFTYFVYAMGDQRGVSFDSLRLISDPKVIKYDSTGIPHFNFGAEPDTLDRDAKVEAIDPLLSVYANRGKTWLNNLSFIAGNEVQKGIYQEKYGASDLENAVDTAILLYSKKALDIPISLSTELDNSGKGKLVKINYHLRALKAGSSLGNVTDVPERNAFWEIASYQEPKPTEIMKVFERFIKYRNKHLSR